MEYLYMMICDGGEWEDMLVYNTEDEAVHASIRNPDFRIEIFARNNGRGPFSPTYRYYQNGQLYESS